MKLGLLDNITLTSTILGYNYLQPLSDLHLHWLVAQVAKKAASHKCFLIRGYRPGPLKYTARRRFSLFTPDIFITTAYHRRLYEEITTFFRLIFLKQFFVQRALEKDFTLDRSVVLWSFLLGKRAEVIVG